jgi:hypothetical protein
MWMDGYMDVCRYVDEYIMSENTLFKQQSS